MKIKVKELEVAIEWWQVLLIIVTIILVLKIGTSDALSIVNAFAERIIESKFK